MLNIENLSFRYPNQKELLFENLSFHCPSAELFYLIGENGSGKTTLLRILGGLAQAHSGQIHVKGDPLSENQISLLQTQNECSFPNLTGRETLRLFFQLNQREYREDLLWMQILNKSDSFQQALITRYGECSTGMRQLMNIAIALTKDAHFYLFDEPFVSLDEKNRDRVTEILEALSQDHLVWVTDHKIQDSMKTYSKILLTGKGIQNA